jgi:putative membrane protein
LSDKALQLLTEWSWEPSILIGTALFVAAYLGALVSFGVRSRDSEKINPAQVFWFLLGTFIIFIALVSPLDAIGDGYLFTAHMVQHALLMFCAPPLLLLGTPGWMLRPLLRDPVVARIARFVTRAPVAFVLFNANMAIWHLPPLYEATLENETVHIIEHLSFIATALLNWMPILSPLPELPRLSEWGRILYLVANLIPSAILGWFFVTATTAIYPTYAAAPRVFGVSGVDDQFIGGYMMSMPATAVYLGAAAIILRQWANRNPKRF